MYFAPPIAYDEVMKKIPYGKVITVGKIREFFAKENGADFTELITAGIFVSIAAWASYQRLEDKTPYWRTLKANGELNEKYLGGTRKQKEKLEAEGHIIIQKGRKVSCITLKITKIFCLKWINLYQTRNVGRKSGDSRFMSWGF